MDQDKFDLLRRNYPEDERGSQNARVQELRAEARRYRDANNILVQQLWAIELRIERLKDEEEREPLMREKDELSHQIEAAGYVEKIAPLLVEINALEIALHGHSDVGGNSPYLL